MYSFSTNEEFNKNGFLIIKYQKLDFLNETKKIIKKYFQESNNYLSYSKEEFLMLNYLCQQEINELNIVDLFFESELNTIHTLFKYDLFYKTSIIKLRALRPSVNTKKVIDSAVGFHRETMYSDSDQTQYCLNIWSPIQNNNLLNPLKYIPYSHLIENKDMLFDVDHDNLNTTEKFSIGHKLGYPYLPKVITKGIDLRDSLPFIVQEGEYIIFSAMLVHGGGSNKSNKIRFSTDVGIIPFEKIEDNKNYFAANLKKHYVPIS